MARQHDSTAPAREALAAWDKLHDEREALNQNLDSSETEDNVSAETVRELTTAAILLEQTNTLLDKVYERQSRRPADEAEEIREEIADTILAKARRKGFTVQVSDDEFRYQIVGPKVDVEGLAKQVAALDGGKGNAEPASKIDTDDRVYELQIHLEDIAGVASIAAEACDDPALNGTFNTIERECHAVREGLDDFLGLSGDKDAWRKAALSEIDRLASEYAEKTPQECAARLRGFLYDVSENLAASMREDGYTVAKTLTRKGVRYFLAEREFMESLLSGDAPCRHDGTILQDAIDDISCGKCGKDLTD